jgi:hypothetical protein
VHGVYDSFHILHPAPFVRAEDANVSPAFVDEAVLAPQLRQIAPLSVGDLQTETSLLISIFSPWAVEIYTCRAAMDCLASEDMSI